MAEQPEQDGSFHLVADTEDVTEDDPLVVEVEGLEVALFYQDGEYRALNNICPHQGGPLANGKTENSCVFCPWHGWQFDLKDGSHKQGIEDGEAYEVTARNGQLYVRLKSHR